MSIKTLPTAAFVTTAHHPQPQHMSPQYITINRSKCHHSTSVPQPQQESPQHITLNHSTCHHSTSPSTTAHVTTALHPQPQHMSPKHFTLNHSTCHHHSTPQPTGARATTAPHQANRSTCHHNIQQPTAARVTTASFMLYLAAPILPQLVEYRAGGHHSSYYRIET